MHFLTSNGITSVAVDTVAVIFLTLLTVASFFAFVYFLCKYADDKSPMRRRKTVLAVTLVSGFVLRIVFGMCIRGYRESYSVFTDMFAALRVNGLDGYYTGDSSTVLYPIVYFVYLIFGGLSNIMGLSDFELGAQFMVKLPLIGADLLIAYAVYKLAQKYTGEKTGAVLCAFVCGCPVFFMGSVIWTTRVVFTAMFAVWFCYFLARKKYGLAIGFATLAAFSSKEGIYLFPVAAVFSVYHLVRAIMNVKADGVRGRAVTDGKYSAVYEVPCAFVLSVLGAYLVGLFMTASYSYNIFKYIYEFTIRPLVGWTNFTYNGLSVYALFNQNGQETGVRFPSWVFACIFAAIALAVVCVVYFSKRNRATMVMLAAYSLVTLSVYFPGSGAETMTVAFATLLGAYALVRDKRLLYVLFVLGIVYIVNGLSVLASAGYLNNVSDFVFTDGGYTGSTLLSGGLSAICITCSALAVAAHLYFTVITVNIGMTGQKRLLEPQSGLKASLKEFFAVRKPV